MFERQQYTIGTVNDTQVHATISNIDLHLTANHDIMKNDIVDRKA